MSYYESTKVIELGSCAFRQWRATHSHCHKFHGYQLKAKFWFGGSHLDEKNWIVDFGGLKDLKKELQDVFDHTLCAAKDDPQLDILLELEKAGACDLRIFDEGVGIERAAAACFRIATKHINRLTNGRCWVNKVEVFEHSDNSATYTRPDSPDLVSTDINVEDLLSEFGKSKRLNTTALVQSQSQTTTTNAVPIQAQPIDVNAARVGPTVTSGIGGLFSGTRLG